MRHRLWEDKAEMIRRQRNECDEKDKERLEEKKKYSMRNRMGEVTEEKIGVSDYH